MKLNERTRGCCRFGLSCFLLMLWIALAGCQPDDDLERWNVVIVTFDTTRADAIGVYGNGNIATPTLDALAADGVLFEQAMVPIPITLPSHASLMTGKVPFAHGVRDNGLFALGQEQLTLAEILRDAGYQTAAAVGSYPVTAQFGIDQGFEFFNDDLNADKEDLWGTRVLPKRRLFFDERRAAQVNEAILPWLEEHHREPFFLWLHYFDPHHPHEPPAPYDQAYVHDLYLGEIAYADESLGTVLGHLERLGVGDRTLVVVTSDHGEGRGEHDESTHSLLVYNSTLHVPLMLRVPEGPRGLRVPSRVGTIDVMPTVLDLLGLPIPEGLQGESLRPHLEGQARDRRRVLYAETLSPRLTRNWGELRALFVGDEKYIHGPRPELYDLASDPREIADLTAQKPERARQMRVRLERFLADHAVSGLDSSVALDEESAAKLRSLGYLQVAGDRLGPIEEALREDGDPPQDHAGTITLYSHAKNLLFQGKAVEAREFLSDLLRTDPGNAHYLEMMAQAELGIGRVDEALALLDILANREDGYPPREKTQAVMANIYLRNGRLDKAYPLLRQAEAIRETPLGQYRLAKIHEARGERLEAERFLEKSLDLDENFAPALIDLAILAAQRNEEHLAEFYFAEAFDAHPYQSRTHYNYGVFQLQRGEPEKAIASLRRAIELQPDYLQALYALVEIFIGQGDVEGAHREFAVMERLAPSSWETHQASKLLMEVS